MADPVRGGMVPRPVRSLLSPLSVSAAGMGRQQEFMEVIAQNIANANTMRTEAGGPYRRQIATVANNPTTGTAELQVEEDQSLGRLVYDPGHPDADGQGYVRFPNVDVAMETVDLMVARRLHEANATAFQAAKSMLRRSLEI